MENDVGWSFGVEMMAYTQALVMLCTYCKTGLRRGLEPSSFSSFGLYFHLSVSGFLLRRLSSV